MDTTAEGDETMHCCASCGIAGVDDIKLVPCDGCDLVKYCSINCQRDHISRHLLACKQRAAELKDEILFKQPESTHMGDCPICCLPLPIDTEKYTLNTCCSKHICQGCNIANQKREYQTRLQSKCPFCRTVMPKTDEEVNAQWIKRIEANDPVAMRDIGFERYNEGDYKTAFEYSAKAAALGDVEAHYQLSVLYREGKGVEKNEKRALYHTEQAAIGGHPVSRHNLGCFEADNGRMDRAVKHWIIAATLGFDLSLKCLKDLYKAGHVSKDDFEAALRGHHAAVDATKSPQREEAAAFKKWQVERGRRWI